ncbi:inter-alpha-trypsin inhibitor heavy chain H3-like [Morone saxatilis]|uniref:inter-alpha-trypsin inhibitor heavy chain H3-like n=1 Tax=Morone saxatilis TaxID=34816 RepID=UPI0015E1FE4B|nr:inter-alpha-trypsin inhibitor heavy chain H3-like [Morone saxatilis]
MQEKRRFCLPGMSTVWRVMLLWFCVCLWPPAQAQGALVVSRRDVPTQIFTESIEAMGSKSIKKRSTNSANTVEVYSVTVGCTVTSRFAHTVVTSKALNKANTSQEIFFEMELPKTAFITNFSMEIDGQVYVGEVKEKEKAKKEYEKAVSSGQTAGLVKASGRKMEKFSVSVNIAAKSNVTFILTYEELLQRKQGQYEILTRVTPKQPVQEFQIVADIYEPQGFAFVEATATFLTNKLLYLVEKTVTDTKAHISFSPTLEQQRKCPGCKKTIIDGDFIIMYDVKREESHGDVQIVNGSTDINDAVLRAVSMLVEERENDKLPERSVDMIILLTDGMPNSGESDLLTIQENVHSAVGGKMTMFCLGFGNDVDYSFLDVLCRQNKGLARRIFEGSDATLQLQGFYEEVSSPLLLDVDLRYPDNAVDHLTKNHYSQLFNGSEIVVSGRLINNDPDNFLVEVFAKGPENDYIVQGKANVVNLEVMYPEQQYIFGDFSERLWAYLTIQQLLEESDITTHQDKETMIVKALEMSLQYSFVTPVTSMVVIKPDTEDGPSSPLIADKLTEGKCRKGQNIIWQLKRKDHNSCVDLLLTKDRSLTVTLKDSVKFVILLHKVWKKHPYHRDYLGFYTLDSHLLSPSVHGLLGQFYHGIEYEVTNLRPGEVPEKPDATMFVKGHELNVTRGWQRDFRRDVKNGDNVPCWFIHTMQEKWRFCFLGMSTVWRVMLLWVCVCLWLPAQAQGALVVSCREAATQWRLQCDSGTAMLHVPFRSPTRPNDSKATATKANTLPGNLLEKELPKTASPPNFSMSVKIHPSTLHTWCAFLLGTDINQAVLTGVDMLVKDRREKKLPERSVDMIILLTDGMPNSGESHLPRIQENVRSAIGGNMSLFCLGFGNNVDYSFLDVMSKQNKGVARRIFEGSDATLQLQGFYDEVSSPLLSDVDLRYPDNAVESLTTNHFNQLFNGSEIVVAGRLMDNDLDNFLVEVFSQGFEEDFNVQGQASAVDWGVMYPDEEYIFGDFTERLWAYLTIQQLLEKSKSGATDEKANATAKALEMSLHYSFVTPLTSMVVTKPETEDGTETPLIADKLTEEQRQQAERHIHRNLPLTPVRHTYSSAAPTYFVDGDPHFMIELPDRDDALCFNVNNKPGTIFNLVRDPNSGILVNGQIIGDKKIPPDGKINTYFWRFGIIHQTLGVKLEVDTQVISVFQDGKWVKLLWSDAASLKGLK